MLHAGRAGSTTAWWHGSGTGTRCVNPYLSSSHPLWDPPTSFSLSISLFSFSREGNYHVEAVGTWNWTIPIPIQTTCPPPLPSSSSPPHFHLLLPAAIIASRLAWLVYRQGHHSTKLFPLLSTSAVSSDLPIRSLASSSSSPQQPFPRSFSAPALHQGTARASTLHFA